MQAVAVDLTNETDVGLLFLIGEATDDPADQSLAKDAMRVFHSRHYGYVHHCIAGFAEQLGTVVVDVDQFTTETFAKAFRSAGGFRDTSGGDTELGKRKVRAWLGKVARNRARDELDRISRRHHGIQLMTLDETTDAAVENSELEDESGTDPRLLSELRDTLDALKPEERDILATYAAFGFPTTSGRQLPPDVRDALEARTGYERSNIRQKWCRLSQRLKSELEPFLPTKKPSSLHA